MSLNGGPFIARGPTYVNNTVRLGKCAGFFCHLLKFKMAGSCQWGICIAEAWFTGPVHFFLINLIASHCLMKLQLCPF